MLIIEYKFSEIFKYMGGVKAIYGGGIRYSLKTILGPQNMTLGYSGSMDKPTFSANFGYWF